MIEVLQSNKLCVEELDLFNAVINWARHKANQENKTLQEVCSKVLQHIRYPQISGQDLIKVVKPTGLAPVELYLQAIEYHATPNLVNTNSIQFKERGSITR